MEEDAVDDEERVCVAETDWLGLCESEAVEDAVRVCDVDCEMLELSVWLKLWVIEVDSVTLGVLDCDSDCVTLGVLDAVGVLDPLEVSLRLAL